MYRISFTDKTTLSVSNEQGEKIKAAQMLTTRPNYVNIDNNQYKLDKITKIEYVPEVEAVPRVMIDSGRKTNHEKSIHKAIYTMFQKELQKPDRRGWQEFRDKAYDYLYSQSPDWCDDRKGTCVCKGQVSEKRVEQVMEMMKLDN